MRWMLVLTPALDRVVKVLSPEGASATIAENPAWTGLPTRPTDLDAYEGYPPPEDAAAGADPIISVSKVDLFRRCHENEATGLDEAGQILEALSQASPRLQAIFNSAMTVRSDAEEWPVLRSEAVRLFGTARADELLAPSE